MPKDDMSRYRDRIAELAGRLANEAGLLVVDIEVSGKGAKALIRLFVDREGGVTVGECQSLSRALGDELDRIDLIPYRYRLEVSSPGLERPFSRIEQYRWNSGQRVRVILAEPVADVRRWEGTLLEVREGGIVVRPDKGPDVTITFDNIKKAHRVIDFNRALGRR